MMAVQTDCTALTTTHTTTTENSLEALVYVWVCEHPGVDAEDVAVEFKLDPWRAAEIVDGLLHQGLLEFGS